MSTSDEKFADIWRELTANLWTAGPVAMTDVNGGDWAVTFAGEAAELDAGPLAE